MNLFSNINKNNNNDRFIFKNSTNWNYINNLKNNLYCENSSDFGLNKNLNEIITESPIKNIMIDNFSDDYYLHKVDSNSNYVSFAVNNNIYLYNNFENNIKKILNIDNYNCPTSILMVNNDIFFGLSDGGISIFNWETNTISNINTMHTSRIGIMKKNPQSTILCSGSKDKNIGIYDYRDYKIGLQIKNNSGEICGMDWSKDGKLLATGSNNNILSVFDIRNFNLPIFEYTYNAGVRAVSFNPKYNHILATGSGLKDKRMIIHNLNENSGNEIQTNSQICSLIWNNNGNKIITSHGYPHNKIIVWEKNNNNNNKYIIKRELIGHKRRVLFLSKTKDDNFLISCSSDQTIKYWKGFQEPNSQNLQFLR